MKHRALGYCVSYAIMVALLGFAAGQGPQAKSFDPRAPNTALRFDLRELEKLIEQTIVEAMEKEHLPGVAFSLVKDGQIIISRGYGFANLEKQTPVTPDKTIFRIGSITKLLTAHAVVQLPEHKLGFFVAYNSDGSPRPRLQATLTQKLLDYWLPVERNQQSVKTPLPIKTERFAGKYTDNVYCHTCYEGDEGVWPISGVTTVKAAGEGFLEIDGRRWLAVEPLLFQSETTGNRIAFRADKTGEITHLVLRNAAQEKLSERLLAEALGADWREQPPNSFVAMAYSYTDQWEKAARAYSSIAARRPRDGGAIFNAGVAWASGGKADEAIAALQRAWELKARPPRTAFWLGAAFGLKGERDKAFEWLNRALELGFDRRRLSAERVLDALRDDPRFESLQKAERK